MGYTKTTWAADTEITSALLNHLETQYEAAAYDIENHNHNTRYYLESEMDSGFWHAGNDGSGSGCDADTLEGHEAAYFAGIGAPSGLIIMFSGATPSGWYDCDGANGTPDLRDRFIVGAGTTYAPGNTGGSASITPTATVTVAAHTITEAELPAHSHAYTDYYPSTGAVNNPSGVSVKNPSSSHAGTTGGAGSASPSGHGHTGSTFTGDSQENRPPFYALKFIMKG